MEVQVALSINIHQLITHAETVLFSPNYLLELPGELLKMPMDGPS